MQANPAPTTQARPATVTGWTGQGRSATEGPAIVQRVVSTLQLATAPTRMMILMLLGDREMFAGEIREALHSPSQPAVSHQLSLLRHGRLIEAQRAGRKIAYRLTDTGRAIVDALDRLDR